MTAIAIATSALGSVASVASLEPVGPDVAPRLSQLLHRFVNILLGQLVADRQRRGHGEPVLDSRAAQPGLGVDTAMGQDLPANKTNAKAPTFAVWALKDPESGNLDRVQIIKSFVNKWGRPGEKIYDVVWSDEDKRSVDVTTGKLTPVGNTVDIKKATYSNENIGATQLRAEWTDPDFDPKQWAAYYVRVLEIPTPRWSTYDAAKLGVAPSKLVPATIQERAWSSPIWYTPAAAKAVAKK